jgi:hypothetical protein
VAACRSAGPGSGSLGGGPPRAGALPALVAASGSAIAHVAPIEGPGRTLGAGEGHVGEVEDDAGDQQQDRGSSD